VTSPAKDIADHLEDLGHGVFGATIFVGEEPASPNNCITVYDTGGGSNVVPDIELYQPTIQVRVRNTSYAAGHLLQEQIRDSLVLPLDFEINESHYIGVWVQSDIMSLGRDQTNRNIFTANYRLERQAI
jgi:hypothetical protein